MYVLYGLPGSRTTRVTWMLEEVGVDYRFVKTRPHSAIAYSVNPSGKLPALKVGDVVVLDSAAICCYLADCHLEAGLTFTAGTTQRAQMESWLHFAMNDLESPLWMFTRQTLLLPEDKRTPAILNLCAEDWASAVRSMESRLGDGNYVMGERFTVPDVVLGHIGRWARRCKYPIQSQSVNSYFDRVQVRPALARALEREEAAKAAG
jgi:glutathione S-transferase